MDLVDVIRHVFAGNENDRRFMSTFYLVRRTIPGGERGREIISRFCTVCGLGANNKIKNSSEFIMVTKRLESAKKKTVLGAQIPRAVIQYAVLIWYYIDYFSPRYIEKWRDCPQLCALRSSPCIYGINRDSLLFGHRKDVFPWRIKDFDFIDRICTREYASWYETKKWNRITFHNNVRRFNSLTFCPK